MFIQKNLKWITQSIALCLLLQIGLTYQLWFKVTSYPFLPFFDSVFPVELSIIASCFLVVGLITLVFDWQNKEGFGLFFFGAILSIVLDVTKLQVWFYFQSILLSLIFFYKASTEKALFKSLQIIFPFLYIWAGFHKINGYYFEDTFPWFMETFSFTTAFRSSTFLILLSIILEIGIGISLWFPATQKIGVVFGVFFHLLILIFLGPFGQNWNHVVWPWNLSMMTLLFYLYWTFDRTSEDRKLNIKSLLSFKPAWLAFLLIGVLPALNSFGLWPVNLSFKMYAGNNPEGILYSSEEYIPEISDQANQAIHCIKESNEERITCYLIVDDWAFADLGVAPFSSPQRLRQLAKYYCSCLEKPEYGGLQILEVEGWKEEKPMKRYPCSELMK